MTRDKAEGTEDKAQGTSDNGQDPRPQADRGTHKAVRGPARIAMVVLLVLFGTVCMPASGGAQPPPAPPEGFVPVTDVPPEEQLPAAPLVIAAYAVAWVAVVLYLWSIWQRLSRVEREMTAVSRRLGSGARR